MKKSTQFLNLSVQQTNNKKLKTQMTYRSQKHTLTELSPKDNASVQVIQE